MLQGNNNPPHIDLKPSVFTKIDPPKTRLPPPTLLTGTAEDELHNLQKDGLVSDEEVAATLHILQAAHKQKPGQRMHDEITIDGRKYFIPKTLHPAEEPLSEEHRASSDWQSTVTSKYCKASQSDPTSDREQCAVCEWMIMVMQGSGVWWDGSKPLLESLVNYPALLDCSRLETWDKLFTASMGVVPFDPKSKQGTLQEQCHAFRDELVTRMSSRELKAWYESTADEVTYDWNSLFVQKQDQQCYPSILPDIANRMCAMNGCCSAAETVGCPQEHYGCAQCEYLLDLRRSVGQGSFGISTMTQQHIKKSVDDVVIRDLQEMVDENINEIELKIQALEIKDTKAQAWLARFPTFLSDKGGLADLMGRMAPMLDGQCWRLRKVLNTEITRQAREKIVAMKSFRKAFPEKKSPTHCYPPKNVGKKRNAFNVLKGTPSCLTVYVDHIFNPPFSKSQNTLKRTLDQHIEESQQSFGDSFEDIPPPPSQKLASSVFGTTIGESRQVCFELIDQVIDAMQITDGQTLEEFLNDPEHGIVFGSSQKKQQLNAERVKNIVRGNAVKCCERILKSWFDGETGRSVAENCDEENKEQKKKAVEAVWWEYRGKMMTEFMEAHHISEEEEVGSYLLDKKTIQKPSSVFSKDRILNGGPIELNKFANEMYDESFSKMADEKDSIEMKLAELQRYRGLAQQRRFVAFEDKGHVTIDLFGMTGMDRWKELKNSLPEKIRDLRTCLVKDGKKHTHKDEPLVDPATTTKGFNAIGPEFFDWISRLNSIKWGAVPKTTREMCGLVYPLCWDKSSVADKGRDKGCRGV